MSNGTAERGIVLAQAGILVNAALAAGRRLGSRRRQRSRAVSFYLAVAARSAAISSRFGPYMPGLTPPARRQSIASWPR
jgi:hypothetical protein